MWWKKNKQGQEIPQIRLILAHNSLARRVKDMEEAHGRLQAQMEKLRTDRDRLEEIEARLRRLEESDFALNKADYQKTMKDLRAGNPGVHTFPE
jgi:DNA repair ATPase RecN